MRGTGQGVAEESQRCWVALGRGCLRGHRLFGDLWRSLMGKESLSGTRVRVGWVAGRCWVSVAVGLGLRRCWRPGL